jgi:hypothetical protein
MLTHIFLTQAAGTLLFADESDDILPLVKAHLKLARSKASAKTSNMRLATTPK